MITPKHLNSLIEGLDDNDVINLTKHGVRNAMVGSRVVIMPGVAGKVLYHDEDGDPVVECKVRGVRHALSFLEAA